MQAREAAWKRVAHMAPPCAHAGRPTVNNLTNLAVGVPFNGSQMASYVEGFAVDLADVIFNQLLQARLPCASTVHCVSALLTAWLPVCSGPRSPHSIMTLPTLCTKPGSACE
jgi:hypothetical protein